MEDDIRVMPRIAEGRSCFLNCCLLLHMHTSRSWFLIEGSWIESCHHWKCITIGSASRRTCGARLPSLGLLIITSHWKLGLLNHHITVD